MDGKNATTGPAVDFTVTASESPGSPSPAAETPDASGQRYDRGAEIGRGGVGVVSSGVDRRLGRSVAIWTLDGAAPRRTTTLATDSGTSYPTPFSDGVRVAWVDHTRGAGIIVGADRPARTFAIDGNPEALAITPDQDAIVSVNKLGAVVWWPLDGRAPRPVGTTAARLANVMVSPSARWVMSSPAGTATLVWPLAGGAARPLVDTDGATGEPVVTMDDWLAVGVGDELVIAPLDGVQPARHLRGHRATVTATTVAPDGSLFATSDEDGEVRLWRRADGATVVLGTWGPGVLVRAVAGDRLAIATRDEVLVYRAVSMLDAVGAAPLPAVLAHLTSAVIDDGLAPRTPAAR